MTGLNSIHVSKRGPWWRSHLRHIYIYICFINGCHAPHYGSFSWVSLFGYVYVIIAIYAFHFNFIASFSVMYTCDVLKIHMNYISFYDRWLMGLTAISLLTTACACSFPYGHYSTHCVYHPISQDYIYTQ